MEERTLLASAPDTAGRDVSDDDPASIDALHPAPRRLADYRQERNLSMRDFTDLLGITQQEYAHVIHRLPIDRRLRDQIAYKLGVPWSAIAEFMPGAALPWPETTPIPAPAGAPPPSEPWYVVHPTTGRIVSGPHNEPLPENAAYVHDPLTYNTTNLVVLFDRTNEEAQLPPEGYIANERLIMEEELAAEDELEDAAYRAMLDELAHAPATKQRL
jgi:hypothetical protein